MLRGVLPPARATEKRPCATMAACAAFLKSCAAVRLNSDALATTLISGGTNLLGSPGQYFSEAAARVVHGVPGCTHQSHAIIGYHFHGNLFHQGLQATLCGEGHHEGRG